MPPVDQEGIIPERACGILNSDKWETGTKHPPKKPQKDLTLGLKARRAVVVKASNLGCKNAKSNGDWEPHRGEAPLEQSLNMKND